MRPLPEIPVKAPASPSPPAHPARLILILSLAPTIGLGIGRFAYSLVLPDMRDALGWSYSAAGFMNTINAAGYLAGALMASRLIRRYGLSAAVRWGTLACVLSLALSAHVRQFHRPQLCAAAGRASARRWHSSPAAHWRRPSRSRVLRGRIFCSACFTPDPDSASCPPD